MVCACLSLHSHHKPTSNTDALDTALYTSMLSLPHTDLLLISYVIISTTSQHTQQDKPCTHPPPTHPHPCCTCTQAGSYNVGGKKPPPGLRLHSWINMWQDNWPERDAASMLGNTEGPDIVAVGFQEIVPLSAGNVIAGPATDGADAWDYVMAATLNGDEWCALACKQLSPLLVQHVA
jgi:hypothetical protein